MSSRHDVSRAAGGREQPDNTGNRLSRRLLAIVILVIAIGLFLLARSGNHGHLRAIDREMLVALAAALLGALGFALLYSWLVERYNLEVVQGQLAASVATAVAEISRRHAETLDNAMRLAEERMAEMDRSHYREISLHFRDLVPTDYFVPGTEPDPRFNRELNESISRTHEYMFKGVTGRHVPARLRNMPRLPRCFVLLLDPRRTDLLRLYVRERFGKISPEDLPGRIAEVQREILTTVVALWELTNAGMIEVGFHTTPVWYRVEICDDKAVASFFVGDLAYPYPASYIYSRGTLQYRMYTTDFSDSRETSPATITMTAETNGEDVRKFLSQVMPDGASIELDALRRHGTENAELLEPKIRSHASE